MSKKMQRAIADAIYEIAFQMEKNRESQERVNEEWRMERLHLDQKYYGDNIAEVVDLHDHKDEPDKDPSSE